jgi:Fe-S cluster assembly scaffold protein SufB
MDQLTKTILEQVADLHDIPQGAYNIRQDGQSAGRRSTENIIIQPKKDKPGIDILIKPNTKNESVHIPVVVTQSGLTDLVYNHFEVGENADVLIVAGCGVHNDGSKASRHDGIHTFHIGKNAKLRYVEKHYGQGEGSGERILNPTTVIEMEEGAYCEMEMVQIKGVDSTKRETSAKLKAGAKLIMIEKLMTHGRQEAVSNMDIELNGPDSVTQIISRSVAKEDSIQIFHPKAIGNERCRAHVQCDSIIMDRAKISSIPEIAANHPEAEIVHEAAIGRINNDQLLKLQTFGLTAEEAESVIVEGFLS